VPLLLLIALAAQAVADPQLRPPVADLASALQDKYSRVKDFSAEFVQVYEGGVLRKKVTERGTVLVKKPGMMRWAYSAPEEKLFVSDGVKLYSYIPADKQVIVSSVPPDDTASTPVLFLAGKGNLTRDFTVSYDPGPASPGTYALKLVPRRREPEYETLVMVVDQNTLQLRSLLTTDRQGGRSTLSFANLKENVGLADKQFTFRVPRGVDVITNGD
jgi:outer membrane lipoprotein carrier protein